MKQYEFLHSVLFRCLRLWHVSSTGYQRGQDGDFAIDNAPGHTNAARARLMHANLSLCMRVTREAIWSNERTTSKRCVGT